MVSRNTQVARETGALREEESPVWNWRKHIHLG